MTTRLRQLRDLTTELEQRTVERDTEAQLKRDAELRCKHLEEDVIREMSLRVAAQRGLVAYMREHGLGTRIGYDPDQDPTVKAQIEAGKIPPSYQETVFREVITEAVA